MFKKTTRLLVSRADGDGHPTRRNIRFRLPRFALLVILLTLCLSLIPLRIGRAAPLRQEMSITSPTEGSTLSGQIDIVGTATHPNFNSYGLLYASGARVTGETNWRLDNPIAWNVDTQVVNGMLGTWDTTQVPNGQYVLALAVFEVGNETPMVYFINNLTVLNEETTPTPEPTPTPDPEEAGPDEGTPTEEAPPPPAAPTIMQPPTATPRPTATLAVEGPADGDEDGGDDEGGLLPSDILSFDAVKDAFRTGAQLALLLYAVGILYAVAKAVIRYYLRQTRSNSNS